MMDPFFFRNRLSAWLDRELPPAEVAELEQAMHLQTELREEAEQFRGRVDAFRAMKLAAPPEVLTGALNAPAPARLPWIAVVPVLILLFIGIWWMQRPEPAPPASVVASNTPEPVVETPEPEAPSPEPVTTAPAVTTAEKPLPTKANPYVPKKSSPSSKSHSRLTVVIPKEIIEDPDATDYAEEDPLPTRSAQPSFRYRLTPNDPNNAFKSLKDLVTHMGGQFLTSAGGAKATYPIEAGTVDRALLKVSAANVVALVQNLATVGTVGVVAQPTEIPPSGMVSVFVEISVPPP